jgi:nitrogen fixation NifU-like protein
MDLYREDVMDHYEHPRNQGELTGKDVIMEQATNASCGDMVQFYIRVYVDTQTREHVITEVKWRGTGCAITTAAASKLSEYLRGRTLKEVQEMSEEELTKVGVGFEVGPGRIKCLTLPARAVKKLLS